MQKLTILPFDMRVPIYCGVVAFAWPYLFYMRYDVPAIWGPLEIANFILPFTPILLIPAFQLRSWRLAFRALWLGPVLMIAHSFFGIFFTIDNRIISDLPFLVPGGLNQMNPGGPAQNLVFQLAIYITLIALVLRKRYEKTVILGHSYFSRILLGGLFLVVLLCIDIGLTTTYWSEVNIVTPEQLRVKWTIASMSWLIFSGAYWSFVFGAPLKDKQ